MAPIINGMYEKTRPDGFTTISGMHAQRGTKRRVSYSAWYEVLGARLIITAVIRYGNRTLAAPDLESVHRPESDSEEEEVSAALVRYIDETTFGFGEEPKLAPSPAEGIAHSASPRSAWADLRTSDWGR